MDIHIVGAGPTGMSLAWEILHTENKDITIYERKSSAGGSWWEPEGEVRDLHAHRVVFNRAFVNTQSLFKEMGIDWNYIFEPDNKDVYGFILKTLEPWDYVVLSILASKVLYEPTKYKEVSLKDAMGPLSENGKRLDRKSVV